jgi:chemotaxis protein CheX
MGAAKKLETNPLLDKVFVNAFVEAALNTLTLTAQLTPKLRKPYIETGLKPRGEIAGIVAMIAGDIQGTLSISFHRQAIFEILESMLAEKYSELTAEVGDAVGELTNQIYGAAKATLNQMGYKFEMAIPKVIQGAKAIVDQHQGATLVIPFTTPLQAEFYVEITVL